jgi:Phosphoribosyl transferase (PRTase)/PELOTA RNA binding domain
MRDLPTQGFSGSYAEGDVRFLLRLAQFETTDVATKEARIQSGQAHYSEMVSAEPPPSDAYMDLFHTAWRATRARHARDVAQVADAIEARYRSGALGSTPTLCSLVRGGVPLGVVLGRVLRGRGLPFVHVGVSIVRGKGLDAAAMASVAEERGWDGVVFVDGWTGKGAISQELERSWQALAGRDPVLAVLADPCGAATITGSAEDWLIPHGLLGANVSGLVSRTVVARGQEHLLHATMETHHLQAWDVSQAYATDIASAASALPSTGGQEAERLLAERPTRAATAAAALDAILSVYGVDDRNRVKPGIAEATRALLRRAPDRVLVRDADDPDLAGLRHLCAVARVPMETIGAATGPWRALTLIAKATR